MGRLNTVLYTIDQRADTTEAEKKVARDNIGAIGFDDVQSAGSDVFKTKQYPIDMHFAANAVIDRLSQNANGEIDAHCSYIYNATQEAAGLMGPYDKAKLDGIAYGAEVNVQSDWNVTDDTSDAFIRNKPNLNMFVTHDELGTRLDAKQDVLTPGRNITIENNVISASADPQVQVDWDQVDSSAVDYIKNKPQNLVQDPHYVHTDNNFTTAEKNKLSGIEAGAETNVQADWAQANSSADDFIKNKPDLSVYATTQDLTTGLSGKQDTLTAGNNITITNNVISATVDPQVQADWAQSDSSAVDFIKNKPANLVQDADYVHTDNNFTDSDKTKLDSVESGAEANVQSDWNQANSSADDYIKNKPDLSVYATKQEVTDGLAGKQDTLTAGSNITITNNVISASAAPQEQADWAQSDTTAVDYIKNKPQNLVQDASYVHTDNNFTTAEKDKLSGIEAGAEANVQADWNQSDSTADDYIKNKPTIPAAQVQSDWDEADTADPAYIKNKPSIPVVPPLKEVVAGAGITITESADAVTIAATNEFTTAEKTKLSGIEAGAEVNVQANWSQSNSSADDYIKNKPANLVQDASYVHTDNNFTTAEKNKLSGIAAGAEVNVQSDWNQSNSSADDYIKNKPAIPSMTWTQSTQGATNVHTADAFDIHQDTHQLTMHTVGGSNVDLGFAVPPVSEAPVTDKVLKMASGNTVPTWSDVPEGHTVGFIQVI